MRMIKLHIALIFLSVALLNIGCRRVKKDVPDSMVTGQTTIAADEALQPLMNAELDVFHSMYNYASVDCKYVSEYDAINLLLQEKIRLAFVTRPFNQQEIQYLKSINIHPESIALGYDAVAVIVHPENKIKTLTTKQISQILSGDILDWGQITGAGMTGSIKQFFDAEASGIIRSLNDSLHLNKKISGEIHFAGTNKNLLGEISSNPNGIGFVGYNWLSETEGMIVQETRKKLNLVAVSASISADSTNSFKPSVSSLFNLKYPLTRRIYALYTDPSASLARGFLAHVTSERGQKIIYRIGLKPENDFQRLVNIKKEL